MMLYIETVDKLKKYIIRSCPYVLAYTLLILVHGYLFGTNDQMDFMPYARHLQDEMLYTRDFYINCIDSLFNERWLLGHLVAFIPHAGWPAAFLILHFGTTLLLLAGMKKWAAHYIESPLLQWATILITLILLYHRNLGGNELYYNMLTASNLAKALGIWALWYSLACRTWRAALLIAICTYIHPIVGTQVFLLSLFLFPSGYKLKPALATLVLISPYLISLFIHLDLSVDGSLFTDIMQVRNGHHFFPERFGLSNYILLTPLFLWGTYHFWKLDASVARMMGAILLGCMVYLLILYISPKYAIMTQWFKATIWLKFFAVLALMHFVGSLDIASSSTIWKFAPGQLVFGIITVFCAIKIWKNLDRHIDLFQLPWNQPGQEIIIARDAKQASNQNDIFLVPPDYTGFKYFAERSTYVDWKAIPHNGACLDQWWVRISKVYGVTFEDQIDLNSIYTKANERLNRLTSVEKAEFKSMGIDFIVFKSGQEIHFTFEKL